MSLTIDLAGKIAVVTGSSCGIGVDGGLTIGTAKSATIDKDSLRK